MENDQMEDNQNLPRALNVLFNLGPLVMGAFVGLACEAQVSPHDHTFIQKLGELTTTKDAIGAAIGAVIFGVGAKVIRHLDRQSSAE
jgi:hypothetical protein